MKVETESTMTSVVLVISSWETFQLALFLFLGDPAKRTVWVVSAGVAKRPVFCAIGTGVSTEVKEYLEQERAIKL